MSGGSSPPSAPKDYMAPYQQGATQQGYGNLQSYGAMPNYAQGTYGQFNPAFGGYGGAAGYNPSQGVNYGNQMSQQSAGMYPAVGQIMNQGFDPQSALYDRTSGQVQQQARAGLESRGLDMTPYGAGLENQAMSNFNIDWQNQQLGRESQAAGAAGNLLGQANAGVGQGQQLGMQVPQWQQQIEQGQQGAGGQNYMFPQSVMNDYMNWMNQGQQGAQNNYQAQFQNWNAQQQQQNAMWSGLGSLAGDVTSMFAPGIGSLFSGVGSLFGGSGKSGSGKSASWS